MNAPRSYAEALIDALHAMGYRTAFGIPGGGIASIFAALGRRLQEAAEQLDVEAGSRRRRRVPLHADGVPVVGLGLDSLDDAVEGAGADLEAMLGIRYG